MKTRMCVLGMGYIGLPTAALFAKDSFQVTGVDVDESKLLGLSNGNCPIDEPGLEELIVSAQVNGSLSFSQIVPEAEVYIICVPTPIRWDVDADQFSVPKPDLTYVQEVVTKLVEVAPPNAVVILESTSPVGTTRKIAEKFAASGRELSSLSFAYCPERVLPGNIIGELKSNTRIVGGLDEFAADRASSIYKQIISGSIVTCTAEVAEMCKLAENSYRDLNIAFANELSMICHELSLDVGRLIELANFHPRVNILKPGIGVGGHCIPVDPWFIASQHPDNATMIRSARRVNLEKTEWVIGRIRNEIEAFKTKKMREPRVALFGLTYKANVADLRESPALEIAKAITTSYPNVMCVEPLASSNLDLCLTPLELAVRDLDLAVVLVAHDNFRTTLASSIANFAILDFCGTLQ